LAIKNTSLRINILVFIISFSLNTSYVINLEKLEEGRDGYKLIAEFHKTNSIIEAMRQNYNAQFLNQSKSRVLKEFVLYFIVYGTSALFRL